MRRDTIEMDFVTDREEREERSKAETSPAPVTGPTAQLLVSRLALPLWLIVLELGALLALEATR